MHGRILSAFPLRPHLPRSSWPVTFQCGAKSNTVQLRRFAGSCGFAPFAVADVDPHEWASGAQRPPGAPGKVTHLAFHAARDDATATGAHGHRAEFVQNARPRAAAARVGPRGEWPPPGAAYDGRRGAHA